MPAQMHYRQFDILLAGDSPGDLRLTLGCVPVRPGASKNRCWPDGGALLKIQSLRPDLILDLNMPSLDGRGAPAEIKNDPALRSTRSMRVAIWQGLPAGVGLISSSVTGQDFGFSLLRPWKAALRTGNAEGMYVRRRTTTIW